MKNLIQTTTFLTLALAFHFSPVSAAGAVTAQPTEPAKTTESATAVVEAETAERSPTPQTVITRILANGVEVRRQSIPDIASAAVLVEFKTGDNHDPRDAPGLSQLLIDLAATASLKADPEPTILSHQQLNKKYPAGWNAQSHPDHAILGYVIPAENLKQQITIVANRIQNVEFNSKAIDLAVKRLYSDLERRFETETQLIPMSWVTAKAFRHTSGALHGFAPEALAKLSADRLAEEWQRRIHPRNIRLYLVGNLGVDESALNRIIEQTFGSLAANTEHPPDLKVTVRPAQGNERRRRIQVRALPSPKEHVVCAYYAPAITAPDHPAFLAVTNEFMNAARRLQGSQSRVAFQYSLLLDPRAAYLTPHHWRFPEGAAQALGYWSVKIKNKRFSNTAGRTTLKQLAWQLGDKLLPDLVEEIDRTPAILFTIAYAAANRARYGDASFWEDYRSRLARLRKDDLAEARDKYLLDNPNIAVFILTPPGN